MNAGTTATERPWDAIVIGGGIGGLVAAAYLARWRKRVLLVEARESFGGRAETGLLIENVMVPVAADILYAFDPQVIADFKLWRSGLTLAERTMPLVGLHPSGRHLELPHEVFSARAAIEAVSTTDARAYVAYRRELFALARRLRTLWVPPNAWTKRRNAGGSVDAVAREFALASADAAALDRIAHVSAGAWLDRWFDSDALKAALAHDATLDGAGPDEPASALMLLWRAAQECGGVQGATAQIAGGPGALSNLLVRAAREEGAVLLASLRATRIAVSGGKVAGVVLDTGRVLEAPIVISGLSARQTFDDFLPPEALPFGAHSRPARPARVASAKVLAAVKGLPPFAGLSPRGSRGRLIAIERIEGRARESLSGVIPEGLVVEATIPSVADASLAPEGTHVLSIRVPYLPAQISGGWDACAEALRKRVLTMMEVYAPGLMSRIEASIVLTPEDFRVRYGAAHGGSHLMERLLQPYETRIRTPVPGLYLCGSDAEPADAISGRSGRMAAMIALAETREEAKPWL
jgi:phytoene dehydrogenase-like protein